MKCGACGGFYDPRCQQWPACRPAEPDPPRRVLVTVGSVQSPMEVRAVFHGFGLDCEEFRDGTGTYSVALVEYEDGKLDSALLRNVRFEEPTR